MNNFITNSIEIFWPHYTSAHCTGARCFHTLESFACWNFWKNVSRERSCLVLSSSSSEKHAFRSNPMLLHVWFRLFSSYSSPPCMLYVYAIYVHVCILTTTYNVIRVSKTYLAVTNNARWSIRSSNWWENAQVRLGYALNYVL